jgi:hypothetical protein
MEFEFANWLAKNETATSTGDVAGFARPMMGMVSRGWLGVWGHDDPFFQKNKKKKKNRFVEADEGDTDGRVQTDTQGSN